MKMKTQDVIFLYETINRIAETSAIGEAPIEVKFILVRNFRITQPIYEDFVSQREALILANSSPEEGEDDPNKRFVSSKQVEYVNNELKKLNELEIEIPVIPIPLKQLESLKLDLGAISGLYPIIQNEEA